MEATSQSPSKFSLSSEANFFLGRHQSDEYDEIDWNEFGKGTRLTSEHDWL